MKVKKPASLLQIGCQGWNYDDWVTPAGDNPVFYPRGTRSNAMLELYARVFDTVEVDSTFYAIPAAATVENWYKRTPAGFTLALKLPQAITHERLLQRDSYPLLEEFSDRARSLKEKLAAVLIQLPPQFSMTPENSAALKAFVPRLPPDLNFALEFRSPEWLHPKVLAFLREYRVAVAFVAGKWLSPERVQALASEEPTADFSYWRWMGERDLNSFARVQRPQDEDLPRWAAALTAASRRIPRNYAYFSNFYEGHAPASAAALKEMLGQTTIPAAALEDQPSLF